MSIKTNKSQELIILKSNSGIYLRRRLVENRYLTELLAAALESIYAKYPDTTTLNNSMVATRWGMSGPSKRAPTPRLNPLR
jgi:hypothetical protein